ncbi:hypothetical protein R6Q59_018593 [Mikania micrantha]
MERTEPTFVPEWLKSSGGLSTTSHQLTSSSLHSGEIGLPKSVRNKSLDKDIGHPSVSDRTNSSFFRSASINYGSAHLRSYSSFNQNHRDRDRDKDISKFRNKEKLVNRHYNYSDPLSNILPSRFEKNGLRTSRSGISGKRGESWPKKVANDLTLVNKSSNNNGDSLLSANVKTSFEKDFPSLGANEKQVDNDVGHVPSLGLSSAIQSLPIGNSSAVIGGDGWTSSLAEVPIFNCNGGNGSTVAPLVQPASISIATGMAGAQNMVEALARGPPRTKTPPQVTMGTQRLEELAVKQSRQLIPMTPSMPKTLALNAFDKQKLKSGQSQFQSSHLMNSSNTPRSVIVKPDVSMTPTMRKLLILKPSRERNSMPPAAKDGVSPTCGGIKLPNGSLAIPSAVVSTSLKNSGNGPTVANLEKKPSLQAQSRSNFFNLMRKKAMTSSNSSSVAPDTSSSGEPSENHGGPSKNHGESVAPEGVLGSTVIQTSEAKVDLTCHGDTCAISFIDGKNHSGPDAILYSEEEEARFLRSLGWEETADEEEGLTEEEISSFYLNCLNLKPERGHCRLAIDANGKDL